jgi:hypothetical protein
MFDIFLSQNDHGNGKNTVLAREDCMQKSE